MAVATITDREFSQFQRFIYDAAGIFMANGKQALVSGRLAKRLAHYQLDSYGDYLRLLESRSQPAELQVAVDLLTTNETYFFREPKHFALLRDLALDARDKSKTLRVWSAASSSGEEPYSIAMVLADVLGDAAWEVLGTDISTRVLERARTGHYPMERASADAAELPEALLPEGPGQRGRHHADRACAAPAGAVPACEPEPALAQDRQLRRDLPAQRDDLLQPGDQAPGGGAPAGAAAPGRLLPDRPLGNAERHQRHAGCRGAIDLSQGMSETPTMTDSKLIDVFLMPGDYFVGDERYRVRTLLGSCVSITLWHPAMRIGAMSHFLLPGHGRRARDRPEDKPGMYGADAMRLLLEGMAPWRAADPVPGQDLRRRCHVPAQRQGARNRHAKWRFARSMLHQQGIHVVSESLFGEGHRQLIFTIRSGEVLSRQVPPEPKVERRASAGARN
jgi:chemotaxis receptor (MCP) glutamine deamidase CheD